jgi:hypothetical protein
MLSVNMADRMFVGCGPVGETGDIAAPPLNKIVPLEEIGRA